MESKIWCMSLRSLLILGYCLAFTTGRKMANDNKEEATISSAIHSPPEGNTTFMGGTTWCVALPGASQNDLQIALDWACGLGMADCTAIKHGGGCYQPDTLLSHASYAFNSYYQQNGNNDIGCYFGGTATLTKRNPSYGKCIYGASGPVSSAPTRLYARGKMTCILPLLLSLRWFLA